MKASLFLVLTLLTFNAQALRFDRACEPGDSILIGAVGDVLLHSPLQKQGYRYGFESLWKGILPFIQGPDLMYANLEGPAAAGVSKGGKSVKDPGAVFDNSVYSGYPLFNYHPSIIEDMKSSGFDLVSTANNHSLDRGALGVRRTIEALEAYGMPYTGTRSDANGQFHTVTRQGSWKIAWIACAYDTNGIPDREDLVLDCFQTGRVSELVKALKPQVDAVIVTPHWGSEYNLKPNQQQKDFGRRWINDGAVAVIGAHPHVPQTWEKYKAADGREGLILYSLGNFVSNQTPTAKQSSLLLFLGLTKKNGRAWVNGVRYLPLFMSRDKGLEVIASNFNYKPSTGQKASLNLVADMYGTERIVQPGEDVVTNAECE